jgi:hypothetical protein
LCLDWGEHRYSFDRCSSFWVILGRCCSYSLAGLLVADCLKHRSTCHLWQGRTPPSQPLTFCGHFLNACARLTGPTVSFKFLQSSVHNSWVPNRVYLKQCN